MSFSNRKKLYSVVLFLLLCVPFSTYSQQNYIHYNKVIPKLEKGNIVTGIWAMSLNLANARSIIEYNGFPTQDEAINNPMIDFVIVAMEHYPYDITALRTFLAGLNSKREVMVKGNLQPSVASFVRLPADGSEPVHAMIKQALDVGVHGVVIPHVSNKEEALKMPVCSAQEFYLQES